MQAATPAPPSGGASSSGRAWQHTPQAEELRSNSAQTQAGRIQMYEGLEGDDFRCVYAAC